MDNGELKAYLETVIAKTNENNVNLFNSYKETTLMHVKTINFRLDELVDQGKIRNGRVEKNEDEIEETNKEIIKLKGLIDNGALHCKLIQEAKDRNEAKKDKKAIRNRWIIGTIIAVVSLSSGWLLKVNFTKNRMIPVELIYEKTDSTMYVPRMYLRGNGDQRYWEVSNFYIDIIKPKGIMKDLDVHKKDK